MRPIKNSLGDWINLKFGDQDGLAEKLKVTRGAVSAYKTGRNEIPMKLQEAIRKLGYAGPWPREEVKEGAAPAEGVYLTKEEFAEWRGYWRAGTEKLLEQLEDLARKVDRLEKQISK